MNRNSKLRAFERLRLAIRVLDGGLALGGETLKKTQRLAFDRLAGDHLFQMIHVSF